MHEHQSVWRTEVGRGRPDGPDPRGSTRWHAANDDTTGRPGRAGFHPACRSVWPASAGSCYREPARIGRGDGSRHVIFYPRQRVPYQRQLRSPPHFFITSFRRGNSFLYYYLVTCSLSPAHVPIITGAGTLFTSKGFIRERTICVRVCMAHLYFPRDGNG
jgi:hypothetical protein